MFSPEGYRALTEGAGVVKRGDRGVLAVTGSDRLSWLQGLLTNDVAALPIGGICDAAYLTPQGRMISDMRVVNFADRTLLDVPASLAEALQKRLSGLLFSEDAEISNLSGRVVIIDVHGPSAPELTEGEGTVRDDAYELPGVSAFVDSSSAHTFIARLTERGAVETSLETLDVVRVEAGRPAYLVDMDEHTIPLEAGLEGRAISFTKGCYVGQEVIVRVTQRGGGRVAKKLVGLRFQRTDLPTPGGAVAAGGRDLGRLTSVVRSPVLETVIGLATIHRDFTDAGTAVEVSTSTGMAVAQVSTLPFIPLALRLQMRGL